MKDLREDMDGGSYTIYEWRTVGKIWMEDLREDMDGGYQGRYG